MNETKSKNISTYKICVIALAVVVNYVGGQIALLLRLPVYLDSIGTFFVGAVLGPIYGMIPNVLSGLIMGMTIDVYSLYYAPVGMLVGLLAGLVCYKKMPQKARILLAALIVTLPTSMVSAGITATLFGGITSSGSTILVQMLSKTPIGLTGACFVVQVITDYIDRVISLILVGIIYKRLPSSILGKLQ